MLSGCPEARCCASRFTACEPRARAPSYYCFTIRRALQFEFWILNFSLNFEFWILNFEFRFWILNPCLNFEFWILNSYVLNFEFPSRFWILNFEFEFLARLRTRRTLSTWNFCKCSVHCNVELHQHFRKVFTGYWLLEHTMNFTFDKCSLQQFWILNFEFNRFEFWISKSSLNFEFWIWILNFEFWILNLGLNFESWILNFELLGRRALLIVKQ